MGAEAVTGAAPSEAVAHAMHGHYWDYNPEVLMPGEDRSLYFITTRDKALARTITGILIPFRTERVFMVDGALDRDTFRSVIIALRARHGNRFRKYQIPDTVVMHTVGS